MTRQQEPRTWLVLDDGRVIYQGPSCAAAIAVINATGLDILRAARNEVLERRWFFGMMGVGV